jgi:hypothetical protein
VPVRHDAGKRRDDARVGHQGFDARLLHRVDGNLVMGDGGRGLHRLELGLGHPVARGGFVDFLLGHQRRRGFHDAQQPGVRQMRGLVGGLGLPNLVLGAGHLCLIPFEHRRRFKDVLLQFGDFEHRQNFAGADAIAHVHVDGLDVARDLRVHIDLFVRPELGGQFEAARQRPPGRVCHGDGGPGAGRRAGCGRPRAASRRSGCKDAREQQPDTEAPAHTHKVITGQPQIGVRGPEVTVTAGNCASGRDSICGQESLEGAHRRLFCRATISVIIGINPRAEAVSVGITARGLLIPVFICGGFMKMSTLKVGLAAVVMAAMVSAATLSAAPTTLTGKVSDAMCAGKHQGDAKACVAKCIKGGEKYVLVVGDKTYKIANQKFAELPKFDGVDAVVTGEVKDDTITISKMAAPKAKSK